MSFQADIASSWLSLSYTLSLQNVLSPVLHNVKRIRVTWCKHPFFKHIRQYEESKKELDKIVEKEKENFGSHKERILEEVNQIDLIRRSLIIELIRRSLD